MLSHPRRTRGARGGWVDEKRQCEDEMPSPRALTKDEVMDMVRRGESLDGADLRGTDLTGIDLAGRSLRNAKLGEALLVRANLSGTDLTGASLWHADLKYADLSGANLEDADLDFCNLEGVTLKGARIRKTTFPLRRVRMDDVMVSVQTGRRLTVQIPDDDDEEPL